MHHIIGIKRMISSVPVLKEFSKTPTITKDLSFVVDKNTNFYEMKTKIRDSLTFLKHIEISRRSRPSFDPFV